jgi:hypothetical protein
MWRDIVSPIVLSNVGLSVMRAIAGILAAQEEPAAPIVMPIAATVVLAKWIYEVYQASCVPLLFLTEKTLSLCQSRSSPALHIVHCRLDSHLTNTLSCVGHARGTLY